MNGARIFIVWLSLCCGLLGVSSGVLAQPVQPMPAGAERDWVQLVTGEWLRGDLVSLFDDEMLFDSEHFDEIVIELEDIAQFYGNRRYAVQIDGVGSVFGELRIEGREVSISDNGTELRYDLGQLVSVTVSVEREIDRWSGELGLGLNVRRGNTDVVEYNMLMGLQRRTPQSRVLIDYIGNFNETEGERVSNNHRVNATVDRFSGGRFFWRPFIGQYFRDPFQNIRNQGTVETGLGFEIIDTPRTDWILSAGFGVNFIRYDSVQQGEDQDESSPAVTISTVYDTALTHWMDYLFDFQFTLLDEDSGAYQHHLLTTLSSDLIGGLDLDVSFVWDRTQKPQRRADGTLPEKDDFRLLVGVTWEF